MMLFLLFLLHLLCDNGAAAPVALLPDLRTVTVYTCDNVNNCRTLFSIVWGCLATIFACTWVCVHPNVPGRGLSRSGLLWEKLKMMFVMIIAPELMVGFAARQYFAARYLSKRFRFSMAHGFFFVMGGFVSRAGYVIVRKEQLEDQELLKAVQNVKEEDIKDKSKGDAFSKGVALLQLLWFTTQCIARLHQRLSITALEVATLAFAAMAFFIWLFWWHKPFDVQRQIVIRLPEAPPSTPVRIPTLDRLILGIWGDSSSDDLNPPLELTSAPAFWSMPVDKAKPSSGLGLLIAPLSGTVLGAIYCAAWNADFADIWLWRICSTVIAAAPPTIFLNTLLAAYFSERQPVEKTLHLCSYLLLFSYVVARLILIAFPFTVLHSMPTSAYMDVNWSAYIPHL